MKKQLLLLSLFALFFLPNVSAAYEVVDTASYKMSADTHMYVIKYQLGFEKYGVYAPIGAIQASMAEADSPYLQYVLEEGEETVEYENVSAVVLSDATVEDGQYVIEAGEAALFTVVVLATVPESYEVDDARMRVTNLPFSLLQEDGSLPNRLSDGELRYYVTPEVE